jgi:hypothetical protein
LYYYSYLRLRVLKKCFIEVLVLCLKLGVSIYMHTWVMGLGYGTLGLMSNEKRAKAWRQQNLVP